MSVRVCAKLECREPAAATAALRYRERQVWIGDLVPVRDPNLFDLCEAHVASLKPLYGWQRIDGRNPLPAAPMGV